MIIFSVKFYMSYYEHLSKAYPATLSYDQDPNDDDESEFTILNNSHMKGPR